MKFLQNRCSSLRLHRILILSLIFLSVPWLAAQDPVITEFLAINRDILNDEDGESADWLEIQNISAAVLDLDGWYLTNNADNLTQWRFPQTEILPGGFLVVFASGKDRAETGQELHTNFKLSSDGEYLALVKPDGATIAHEYTPVYPVQRPDLSYGLGQDIIADTFVTTSTSCTYQVPADGSDESDWFLPAYSDAGWATGTAALGYDRSEGVIPGELDLTNIAPEGTATQSSECYNMPPGNAIDGNTGNFTHTCAEDTNAWWELDLGDAYYMDTMIIVNRSSCCQSRLRDITVTIMDAGDQVVFESELLNPENEMNTGGNTDGPSALELDLVALTGNLVTGSKVRIQRTSDPDLSGSNGQGNDDEANVLSLGEVEILGASADQAMGYNTLINTDLETAMFETNSSVYIRIPFFVDNPTEFEYLTLDIQYDDGFVAYLNGTAVAWENAPATVGWNAAATADREPQDVVQGEAIDLSDHRHLLVEGDNLLAIHGLNSQADAESCLITAKLMGNSFLQMQPTYFETPTPGEANSNDTISGFVADTTFSHDRGFYDDPFFVTISSDTPGAVIRYTLDGTPPSTSQGTRYDAPILVDGTTVLRAIAYLPDSTLLPTNVDTHSYFFLDDVIQQDYQATLQAGYPSSWGGTSPDYGMDPDVLGPNSETIKDDLLSLPTLSIVMDIDDMFGSNGIYTHSTSSGSQWERPTSAELIYPNGDNGFQENCGIRIQGGWFRSHSGTRKHSLRLLFKAIYGDTKLRFPLFGPHAVDRFDTITMRAGANDGYSWNAARLTEQYTRDNFGRSLQRASGNAGSHGLFVHLYINGIYWGLYNPVERPDASFSAMYYGGDKENWDSVHDGSMTNGSSAMWNAMRSKAAAATTSLAAFQELQGRNPDGTPNPDYPHLLDVPNYADYLIVNIWGGNWDWPWKNWWGARENTDDSTGFKFYCWDFENTMGNNRSRSPLSKNALNNNFSSAGEMHANLQSNPEYRMLFADRIHRLFFNDGILSPDRLIERYADITRPIERAIVAESARWGDQHHHPPLGLDEWEDEYLWITDTYLPQRSDIVMQQFRGAQLYPDLEAPEFNQHGGDIEAGFVLNMNGPMAGVVYYTLDGTDPRLPGGAISPHAEVFEAASGIVLIDEQTDAKALVPTNNSLGLSWTDPDFDDAGWLSGKNGIGFERSPGSSTSYSDLIGLDVESQAYNINATLFARLAFQVDDPDLYSSLILLMKYDDGFVVYLNGTRIADESEPAVLDWDADAEGSHSDTQALVYENIPLNGGVELLRTGENVLAIHGLNSSDGSSDFLILPKLLAVESSQTEGMELNETTLVMARTYLDGQWSALNEATFRIPSPLEALRITEIMYNPPDNGLVDGDAYEFLEFQNIGAERLDLSNAQLAMGIDYTFPQGTSLGAGQFLVLASDVLAFQEKYPDAPAPAGAYSRNLANTGDNIALYDAHGEMIFLVTYNDLPPWPEDADGLGYSLVPKDPLSDMDPNDARFWVASSFRDGSPGEADPGTGPMGGWQLPGDLNQDAALDLSDAVSLLIYLYGNDGPALPCQGGVEPGSGNLQLLDLNDDDKVDLGDGIYLLAYLFSNGPEPASGSAPIRIEGCPNLLGN